VPHNEYRYKYSNWSFQSRVKQAVDEPQPFVRSGTKQELRIDLRDGTEAESAYDVVWKLNFESSEAAQRPQMKSSSVWRRLSLLSFAKSELDIMSP
jgi:hypothetical protein